MPLRVLVTIQLSGTKRCEQRIASDIGAELIGEKAFVSGDRCAALCFGKLWRLVLRAEGLAPLPPPIRLRLLSLLLLHEIGNKMTERAYECLSDICVPRQTLVAIDLRRADRQRWRSPEWRHQPWPQQQLQQQRTQVFPDRGARRARRSQHRSCRSPWPGARLPRRRLG